MTNLDEDIALAAVNYRRAMLHLTQNESDVANGGRNDGSSQEAVDKAEQDLDGLLRQRFGPCWNLKPVETWDGTTPTPSPGNVDVCFAWQDSPRRVRENTESLKIAVSNRQRMKTYPSIPTESRASSKADCWVWGKHDGSQMRLEWSPKQGFHRWGRRGGLLDDSNPILKRAPDIWSTLSLAETLDQRFRKARLEGVTLYMEMWGPNSFAGSHDPQEQQTLSLFDLDVKKKGILPPDEFHNLTQGLDNIVPLLYKGPWDSALKERVYASQLPGMPFEGVVVKQNPERKGQPVVMWKMKSKAWYDRLRKHCGTDTALFDKLS